MSAKLIQPKEGSALSRKNPVRPRAEVEELAEILLFFQRRFLTRLSSQLAPGSMSFAQFFLLTTLRHRVSLNMSEIAHRMGNTTAAATGLVDRLENLDYVERTHATDDRRKVLVRITDRGAELVAQIKEDMIQNLNALMTYLSAEEQAAWLA
ncbi:MAG: MarR family transcriptional regulator, partial [Acidobacteriaceae bacterium]|nr:MarR family transcriptional regulator [Acidobacteriaceae bacterium]